MKRLLFFLKVLFFLSLGILMFNAPKIFGTEGAQGDGLPEIMQYFGVIIFLLSLLVLSFYTINWIFNKNLVLKWAFMVGFYALIPVLVALLSGGLRTQGEGSPLYILMLPIFWPLFIVIPLSAYLVYLLTQMGIEADSLFEGLTMLLNVVWAVLIGMLVGWLIKRRREKARKKNEK